MDAVILQENIEGLLNLVRMLLPGGGSAGCVYLDDLSALQRSIHKQIKMGIYTPMTFLHYNNQSTKR